MSEGFVVVPWAPGPLIVPHAGERAPDEVEEFVDELFGPDVDEKPGWFDAFLFLTGTTLFVWALLSGASPALTVIGAGAALLGCVLPARTLWRGLRRRGSQRRRRAAMTSGLPLLASDPVTGKLVAAYGRLQEAATLPDVGPIAEEAVNAAHQALVEAATLLNGAAPSGAAEEEYVSSRARAVEKLAGALEQHHQLRAAMQAREELESADADRELERAARLQATEELDARLGPASLDRLSSLTQELEAGPSGDR
jgi:hypothetical protein